MREIILPTSAIEAILGFISGWRYTSPPRGVEERSSFITEHENRSFMFVFLFFTNYVTGVAVAPWSLFMKS
jgi:hypothetical protein